MIVLYEATVENRISGGLVKYVTNSRIGFYLSKQLSIFFLFFSGMSEAAKRQQRSIAYDDNGRGENPKGRT